MARILVIDDDDAMRPMLQRMLERLGHDVQTEPNGAAGMKRARDWKPDLIITDLMMPEKDGMEAIVEIGRLSAPPRIIAMSGGGRLRPESLLDMARKLGASYTLTKPFSRDELKVALDHVLPRAPVVGG